MKDINAAEFLELSTRFLGPREVAELRGKVLANIKAQVDQMEAQFRAAAGGLARLRGKATVAPPPVAQVAPRAKARKRAERIPGQSATVLCLAYAKSRHPGSLTAGEFRNHLREKRGKAFMNNAYAAVSQLVTEGRLRREGIHREGLYTWVSDAPVDT